VNRDLEFYLKHEYSISLRPLTEEEGGGWLAEIPDLPGCISDGETPEEALKNLESAKRTWLKTALKRGQEIPLPKPREEEYSGRLTLRMPRSFHRRLAQTAEREGTSLNQLILNLLSLGYGVLSTGPSRKLPRVHVGFALVPEGSRPEPAVFSLLTNTVSRTWSKHGMPTFSVGHLMRRSGLLNLEGEKEYFSIPPR